MTPDRLAHENNAEDAIEITPEMIKAGVMELIRFDRDYESDESAVIRIFQEMYRALA